MGIFEEIPELYMVVPAVIGVACVALTVIIIFWVGLGKQTTFEEAKASATRRADLALQEKEYKNSPRAKKGKRQFPRKKKADQWEEPQEETEDNDSNTQTPKGILKPATVTSRKETTPERSPRNRVGFSIDSSTKEDAKSPRTSPPTPYPTKTPPAFKPQEVTRTAQPLFEEPEEEVEVETVSTLSTAPPPRKPKVTEPKKTQQATAVTTSSTSSPKPAAQKKRQKAKKDTGEGLVSPDDGLPATRIAEIVGVSSLSDDDIQQLMSVLLEKMNTNSEWEAANLRSESVKSLKKQNQDLQKRCEEAERTMHSHSSKIKELRSEIQNDRAKHQSTDNVQQGKITAQTNELTIIKTRLAGVEEENKQIKSHAANANLQKLEEENAQLRSQIHQLSTTQTQQLSSQSKQLKDLTDENTGLKTELHRVKEAYKSASAGQPRGDRVTELESLLGNMEEEKQGLQATMQMINDENSKLKLETSTMQSALAELEQLKAKAANLEADKDSLADEKTTLHREIEMLRTSNDSSQNVDNSETLRVQFEDKMESVRGEMTAQHEVKVQSLQGTITDLEGQCDEKDREVGDLKTQIEKCSSLQDQLKTLSEQLTGEQTAKKDLEQELESLKTTTSNGPSTNETDATTPPVNEEELTQLREEKDELTATVKELEKKLNDVKDKNNAIRDSLWKAKDTAAEEAKTWEGKVKEAHKRAEQRCKEVRKDTLSEAQEAQKTFLTQLFPDVTVSSSEFTGWLDEFEVKVQAMLDSKNEEVSSLQSKVVELQENETKIIEEAEQFRNTLQSTMGMLEKLQSEFEGHDTEHKKTIAEKEEMIEREKTSNRLLQEELVKEKKLTSSLKVSLEAATASESPDNEAKINDLDTRLKEAEHQHQLSKKESESLRHSLQHELEMKDGVQQELEQLQEKQAEIEKRLSIDEEEKKQSAEKKATLETELDLLKAQLKEAEGKSEASKLEAKVDAPPNPAVDSEV